MLEEVNTYFDNLTDEEFICDIERAGYSFYKDISVALLSPVVTVYSQYKSDHSLKVKNIDKIFLTYLNVELNQRSDQYEYCLAA
jgi:hypothetical protein